MLRFRYMPSDYHPIILMLGDAEDLRRLATLLLEFARQPFDRGLDTLDFCAPSNTKILLTPRGGSQGVRAEVEDDNQFIWLLDAHKAEEFAFAIESIISRGQVSGSEVLECEHEGEIPVKVSHGEYMDEFLMPLSRLPA